MSKLLIGPILLVAATIPTLAQPPSSNVESRQAEVRAFNQKLEDATRHMDNAASLALWAEDGISLLPSTPPLIGKPAIAAFLNMVTASLPGAHMQSFEWSASPSTSLAISLPNGAPNTRL